MKYIVEDTADGYRMSIAGGSPDQLITGPAGSVVLDGEYATRLLDEIDEGGGLGLDVVTATLRVQLAEFNSTQGEQEDDDE
jgi:hypothetical protein